MQTKQEAARRAIAQLGGLTKAAKALRIENVRIVSNWPKRGVSIRHVLDVEKETGIPRHELRPDIFEAAQ